MTNKTVFGELEMIVENSLEFANRGYTNLPLKAHTDNTYIKDCAG